jgi:hypothetical protein
MEVYRSRERAVAFVAEETLGCQWLSQLAAESGKHERGWRRYFVALPSVMDKRPRSGEAQGGNQVRCLANTQV